MSVGAGTVTEEAARLIAQVGARIMSAKMSAWEARTIISSQEMMSAYDSFSWGSPEPEAVRDMLIAVRKSVMRNGIPLSIDDSLFSMAITIKSSGGAIPHAAHCAVDGVLSMALVIDCLTDAQLVSAIVGCDVFIELGSKDHE